MDARAKTYAGMLIGVSGVFPQGAYRVERDVKVTLDVTKTVQAESCSVSEPGFILGRILVTRPDEQETELARITNADVSPSGNCLGFHTAARATAPLSSKVGLYALRFEGYHSNHGVPGGGWYSVTPAILIEVDGKLAVKQPYPAVTGSGSVSDEWVFDFAPVPAQPAPAAK